MTNVSVNVLTDMDNFFDNLCGSSNGTYVNYMKIRPGKHHHLKENDIIGIGVDGSNIPDDLFFVFKLIHKPLVCTEMSPESIYEDALPGTPKHAKRSYKSISPESEKHKRLKITKEDSTSEDMLEQSLLNYTQNDNDLVTISEDEDSVVQIFEKSFKTNIVEKSEMIDDNSHNANFFEPFNITASESENEDEVICVDSDNEETDMWINKLSQNLSIKQENEIKEEEVDMDLDAGPILPLSQNLIKMIMEDESNAEKQGATSHQDNINDLGDYDFIAHSGEKSPTETVLKPCTVRVPKVNYVKPPIIEAPALISKRRSSEVRFNHQKEVTSKAKGDEQKIKDKQKIFEKPKKKVHGRRSSELQLTKMEKNEREKICEMRKNRLKEIAEKAATRKERDGDNMTKIVSKPKVKFTENNRGAFLTDDVQNAKGKKDKQNKTEVSRLPKIPKKINKSESTAKLLENDPDLNGKDCNLSTMPSGGHGDNNNDISCDKGTNLGTRKDDQGMISERNVDVNIESINLNSKKDVENHDTCDKHNKITGDVTMKTVNKSDKPPVLKSCLKASNSKCQKRRSVQIIMRPVIQYFEIEEGNKLGRCNMKDVPFNWQSEKKRATPIICNKEVFIKKIDNMDDIIFLITSWNPLWLEEQKKFTQAPPLLVETSYKLTPMLHSYVNYSDYEKTVYPLMIMELWATISREWYNRDQFADQRPRNYSIAIDKTFPPLSKNIETKTVMVLYSHMLLNKADYYNNVHPREGDLIIIGLVQSSEDQEKKVQNVRKRFAFVSTVRKVIAGDQGVHQGLSVEVTEKPYAIAYMQLKTMQRNWDVDIKKIIGIYVISYINPVLRNIKAIFSLQNSPLCVNVLNPSEEQFVQHQNSKRKYFDKAQPNIVLNTAQEKAVMDTVSDCMLPQPMISLIQGPPGTGKSKVIVSIIQQLLYGENLRPTNRPKILICAPSNAAIDEIVCRLLHVRQLLTVNKFRMVRFGILASMNSKVQDISLQTLVDRDVAKQIADMKYPDMQSLETEQRFLEAKCNSLKLSIENAAKNNRSTHVLKDKLMKFERKLNMMGSDTSRIPHGQMMQMKRESQRIILSGADIICTTLASCVNGQITSSNLYFNICIVDEATQCTEPDTLMPLMLGISKLILVGDPQQLPATVLSQESKNLGFQKSLFTRIESCLEHTAKNPVKKLCLQYRMHPEICHWPNSFFYQGSLENATANVDVNNTLQPYSVFSLNYSQSSNFSNIKEADFVINLATTVIKLTTNLNYTIGIITPYQSQKACITNKLKNWSSCFEKRLCDANTIDSIQGQERDVIIISLARTDGVGFLAEFERLNVALTRAKHSLFVCGNFSSLKRNHMWAAFMKDAQERNFFRDAQDLCSKNYDRILNLIAKK